MGVDRSGDQNFGTRSHIQILVRPWNESFRTGMIYSRMEGFVPEWNESFRSGKTYTVIEKSNPRVKVFGVKLRFYYPFLLFINFSVFPYKQYLVTFLSHT